MSLSWDDPWISQRKRGFLGSGLLVWYLCEGLESVLTPGEGSRKFPLQPLKEGCEAERKLRVMPALPS